MSTCIVVLAPISHRGRLVRRLLLTLHRTLDQQRAIVRARNRAFDKQQVALSIDPKHLEVLHGHPLMPHMTGHSQALEHASRCRTGTNRSWCPMTIRLPVRLGTSGEAVSL